MSTGGSVWSPNQIAVAVSVSVIPIVLNFILSYVFPADRWFCSLKRPCFFPPWWSRTLVWIALYILLGVSATIVGYDTGNAVYWILPLLNIITSLLFIPVVFGLHSLFGGVIITFLCLAFGIGTLWQFAVVPNYLATGLMIPYVVWMLFEVYLMWNLYQCNPNASNGRFNRRRSCMEEDMDESMTLCNGNNNSRRRRSSKSRRSSS